ncbi:Glutathione S-transferase 1 [Stylophora pistillata]|nr:Glutathione S-transferase 1 [Stylophora pistillata]
MAQYKLTYFNIRGRAEATRLIFKAAGVEFEDHRISFEDWGALKATGKFPFAQLPVLEFDGEILAQSLSIARYVANVLGLAPATDLLKAKADMLVDSSADLMEKYVKAHFEKDETRKAKLYDDAKAATPGMLKGFQDILKANNGGKAFFVGEKLTYADIAVFNMLNHLFVQGKVKVPEEIQAYPLLESHYKRIMEIPNIKKWLEARPETLI